MNLENLISSLIIPSAAKLKSPPPSSYINLLNGIFETIFNLSLKYLSASVSDNSGPSPPRVSISGDSPSLDGNQYSLLNWSIGFPLVANVAESQSKSTTSL